MNKYSIDIYKPFTNSNRSNGACMDEVKFIKIQFVKNMICFIVQKWESYGVKS